MVFFIAIPALASTPENENAPAVASEDQQFMGLTQLSEEECVNILGQVVTAAYDYNTTGSTVDITEYDRMGKEFARIVVTLLRAGYRIFDVTGWFDSIILGIENDWTIQEIIYYQLFANH
jgi:hypothetical protein